MKAITRNVRTLSAVSLFTDVASEMLYPVMPVYLHTIGFSVIFIGILEGMAEAITGYSKGYFGSLSDRSGRRLPFVRAGYFLSGISKPLLAISAFPLWVFVARALDRLGKGIRTAPRDAMLSDESTPATRAQVFGFHRALDTTGAFIGPVFALAYLAWRPGDYVNMFLIAFVPGMAAFGLTFLIREKPGIAKQASRVTFSSFVTYWKTAPHTYRQLTGALLAFALFNSSDIFLLLRVRQAGYSDGYVIGAYIFYNLVYALFSYPLGRLADRSGMKRILCAGLVVFAAVYGLIGFMQNIIALFGLFFLYGIYSAATEGVAKALISNISESDRKATAIGTFTAFQSIALLTASVLAGVIWTEAGPAVTFSISAAVALMAAVYLGSRKI